jgi:hypothetical protein
VTLLELARRRRADRTRAESAAATAALLSAAADLRAAAAGLPPASARPYLEEAELFEFATCGRQVS